MGKTPRISSSSIFFDASTIPAANIESDKPFLTLGKIQSKTAIVYFEGNFGGIDGKTVEGLVRHSQKYEILSIIDSEKAGLDAGEILDGKLKGISICRDLDEALANAGRVPDYFIFEIAPASEVLSPVERQLLLRVIKGGMNIVSGLHEFLNDDPEIAAACAEFGVVIRDVRKLRSKKRSKRL